MPIELDIGVAHDVGPLGLCMMQAEAVDQWIDSRRSHLRKTLIPKPTNDNFSTGIGRMFLDSDDHAKNQSEFERRLDDHLDLCRRRLLENALTMIVRTGRSNVSFVVTNPSEYGIAGLELRAQFYPGDALVLTGVPATKAMPPPPRWPHFADRFPDNAALLAQFASSAAPFDPQRPSVRTESNRVVLDYRLGNLGPQRTVTTFPITIVPGPNFEGLTEYVFDLSAHAVNRKSLAKAVVSVALTNARWILGDLIDPRY